MTDVTNDPVAQAAAQLHDAQPSSAEPQPQAMEVGMAAPDPTVATASAAPVASSSSSSESQSEADAPNAVASAAASASAVGSASSVSPASPVGATADRVVSESLVERAKEGIGRLRAHLWSFEQSTVAHLHRELDFIESLFK